MQALRAAIVSIVNNDATIATYTNRAAGATSRQIVAWSDIGTLENAGIGFVIISAPQTGEDNDTRRYSVQFSCFAKTIFVAQQLADRLEAILTATNLFAQGVNGAPIIVEQIDHSELEDPSRKMKRIDLTIEFNVIKS